MQIEVLGTCKDCQTLWTWKKYKETQISDEYPLILGSDYTVDEKGKNQICSFTWMSHNIIIYFTLCKTVLLSVTLSSGHHLYYVKTLLGADHMLLDTETRNDQEKNIADTVSSVFQLLY